MSGRTDRNDAGVTLVELLVTVSILGILMVALTSAIVVGFRSTRDTHTSLDQSNAEQIISTYVTKDVQRADAVVAPATMCGGAVPKLELRTRSNALAVTSDVTITYTLRPDGDLVRCVDASTSTIANDVTKFEASGNDTVTVAVEAAGNVDADVAAYSWTLEVRRRQT